MSLQALNPMNKNSQLLSFEIPAALDGQRIDRALAILTGFSRSTVNRICSLGGVELSGNKVNSPSIKIKTGDLVIIEAPEIVSLPQPDPLVKVEIAYQDSDVVVINKQAGLVVHPGSGNTSSTLVNGLLELFPDLAQEEVGDPTRPGIVHRLDKDTSGLMVVALTKIAYESLVSQLKDRSLERRYSTLAVGHVKGPKGIIDAPIARSHRDPKRMAISNSGKLARTHYEVVNYYKSPFLASFLECKLETGRTHQIRVHLETIGHPVVGDPRYGKSNNDSTPKIERIFLHAKSLSFIHPRTFQRMSFYAELPKELEQFLQNMNKD